MACERVVVDEVGAVLVCSQEATQRTAEEVLGEHGPQVVLEHWCAAHLTLALAERPARVEVPRSTQAPLSAQTPVVEEVPERCSASTYRGKTGGPFGPGEFNRCIYLHEHAGETHLDTWGHRFRISEGKVRILGIEAPTTAVSTTR